ncbi:MAG: hypothetical protein QOK89_05000, partial [Nitrososphaeraceae archaeon]|nr:hypothetical protein [Nitrososphaeraceae archaeon]
MKYHLLKQNFSQQIWKNIMFVIVWMTQVERCSIYKPSTLTACLFRLWQIIRIIINSLIWLT